MRSSERAEFKVTLFGNQINFVYFSSNGNVNYILGNLRRHLNQVDIFDSITNSLELFIKNLQFD